MGIEKLKFEIRHGGAELHLEERQTQALFVSYKEQFLAQQGEGGNGLKDSEILDYLHYVLAQPETVVLFSEGEPIGMGGIRYYQDNPSYPKNSIVELGTLIVTHAFRGNGISEEILAKLQEEALARNPLDRGIIFSLITANPIVEHQATKANYRPQSSSKWVQMTGSPDSKTAYLEKWGYKPYVNMEHAYNDPGAVNKFLGEVRSRVATLLRGFKQN
ncbi:MAG: GNAT family N-acetyltransferase [Candidatus Gracilibacteria bacterium]|jgi:hypothetical protein